MLSTFWINTRKSISLTENEKLRALGVMKSQLKYNSIAPNIVLYIEKSIRGDAIYSSAPSRSYVSFP